MCSLLRVFVLLLLFFYFSYLKQCFVAFLIRMAHKRQPIPQNLKVILKEKALYVRVLLTTEGSPF